jgi:hypothetical protein
MPPNPIKVSTESQIDPLPASQFLPVEKRDWRRIRRLIDSLKDSHGLWENACWSFISFFVAFLISGFSSTGNAKLIFFIISACCFVIAIILFLASKAFLKGLGDSKQSIIAEMDEIEKNIPDKNTLILQDLEVLEAFYGAPNNMVLVTDYLNESISDDKLNLVVSNKIVNGDDPALGIKKDLIIKYQFRGKISQKTFKEDETINLP